MCQRAIQILFFFSVQNTQVYILRQYTKQTLKILKIRLNRGVLTCLRNVIGFWPMAWASPMFALMTSVKGFLAPWKDKEQMSFILIRKYKRQWGTRQNIMTFSGSCYTDKMCLHMWKGLVCVVAIWWVQNVNQITVTLWSCQHPHMYPLSLAHFCFTKTLAQRLVWPGVQKSWLGKRWRCWDPQSCKPLTVCGWGINEELLEPQEKLDFLHFFFISVIQILSVHPLFIFISSSKPCLWPKWIMITQLWCLYVCLLQHAAPVPAYNMSLCDVYITLQLTKIPK